ncbi:hypothetical protein NESM_000612800 [Novymonas esmeraldas]|uniref:Metaxin glutathione S-transferase domain-containing protein n=1 Tax=Novymonas esmeraldas TaxID=1808958 RepID=A0AAW0EUH8_9TRYP
MAASPPPPASSSSAAAAAAPPTTILTRYPAALSLPTADPSALAVEAMLRFVGARYTRADARMADLSLTIAAQTAGTSAGASADASAPERWAGLLPCLQRLRDEPAVDAVPRAHAATAVCVEVLTTQCLFPAFVFLTHFDSSVYTVTMRKSVEPKVASLWESVRGTYRTTVLHTNPFLYSGATAAAEVPRGRLSQTALAKLKEVSDAVDKAMAALESLCVSAAAAAAATAAAATTRPCPAAGANFFLGTSRPTHVDALVYAAASCFIHADVGAAAVGMREHQRRLQDACPALLQYVERLRHQFFESDGGSYCLAPRDTAAEAAAAEPSEQVAKAAEQQYRRGRLQTLWWTGLFATVYFVLVNVDMLVALLEAVEEEGEVEEAGEVEVMGEDAAGGQSTASSSSERRREPQEL